MKKRREQTLTRCRCYNSSKCPHTKVLEQFFSIVDQKELSEAVLEILDHYDGPMCLEYDGHLSFSVGQKSVFKKTFNQSATQPLDPLKSTMFSNTLPAKLMNSPYQHLLRPSTGAVRAKTTRGGNRLKKLKGDNRSALGAGKRGGDNPLQWLELKVDIEQLYGKERASLRTAPALIHSLTSKEAMESLASTKSGLAPLSKATLPGRPGSKKSVRAGTATDRPKSPDLPRFNALDPGPASFDEYTLNESSLAEYNSVLSASSGVLIENTNTWSAPPGDLGAGRSLDVSSSSTNRNQHPVEDGFASKKRATTAERPRVVAGPKGVLQLSGRLESVQAPFGEQEREEGTASPNNGGAAADEGGGVEEITQNLSVIEFFDQPLNEFSVEDQRSDGLKRFMQHVVRRVLPWEAQTCPRAVQDMEAARMRVAKSRASDSQRSFEDGEDLELVRYFETEGKLMSAWRETQTTTVDKAKAQERGLVREREANLFFRQKEITEINAKMVAEAEWRMLGEEDAAELEKFLSGLHYERQLQHATFSKCAEKGRAAEFQRNRAELIQKASDGEVQGLAQRMERRRVVHARQDARAWLLAAGEAAVVAAEMMDQAQHFKEWVEDQSTNFKTLRENEFLRRTAAYNAEVKRAKQLDRVRRRAMLRSWPVHMALTEGAMHLTLHLLKATEKKSDSNLGKSDLGWEIKAVVDWAIARKNENFQWKEKTMARFEDKRKVWRKELVAFTEQVAKEQDRFDDNHLRHIENFVSFEHRRMQKRARRGRARAERMYDLERVRVTTCRDRESHRIAQSVQENNRSWDARINQMSRLHATFRSRLAQESAEWEEQLENYEAVWEDLAAQLRDADAMLERFMDTWKMQEQELMDSWKAEIIALYSNFILIQHADDVSSTQKHYYTSMTEFSEMMQHSLQEDVSIARNFEMFAEAAPVEKEIGADKFIDFYSDLQKGRDDRRSKFLQEFRPRDVQQLNDLAQRRQMEQERAVKEQKYIQAKTDLLNTAKQARFEAFAESVARQAVETALAQDQRTEDWRLSSANTLKRFWTTEIRQLVMYLIEQAENLEEAEEAMVGEKLDDSLILKKKDARAAWLLEEVQSQIFEQSATSAEEEEEAGQVHLSEEGCTKLLIADKVNSLVNSAVEEPHNFEFQHQHQQFMYHIKSIVGRKDAGVTQSAKPLLGQLSNTFQNELVNSFRRQLGDLSSGVTPKQIIDALIDIHPDVAADLTEEKHIRLLQLAIPNSKTGLVNLKEYIPLAKMTYYVMQELNPHPEDPLSVEIEKQIQNIATREVDVVLLPALEQFLEIETGKRMEQGTQVPLSAMLNLLDDTNEFNCGLSRGDVSCLLALLPQRLENEFVWDKSYWEKVLAHTRISQFRYAMHWLSATTPQSLIMALEFQMHSNKTLRRMSSSNLSQRTLDAETRLSDDFQSLQLFMSALNIASGFCLSQTQMLTIVSVAMRSGSLRSDDDLERVPETRRLVNNVFLYFSPKYFMKVPGILEEGFLEQNLQPFFPDPEIFDSFEDLAVDIDMNQTGLLPFSVMMSSLLQCGLNLAPLDLLVFMALGGAHLRYVYPPPEPFRYLGMGTMSVVENYPAVLNRLRKSVAALKEVLLMSAVVQQARYLNSNPMGMDWADLIMRRSRRHIDQLKQARVLSAEELQGMWMRLQSSKYPWRISALKARLRSNNSTAARLKKHKQQGEAKMQKLFKKQDKERSNFKSAIENRMKQIQQMHDKNRDAYNKQEDESYKFAQSLYVQVRASLFEGIRFTRESMRRVQEKLIEKELKEDVPVVEWVSLDRKKLVDNLNAEITARKVQSANNFVEIMKEEEKEKARSHENELQMEDVVDNALRAAYKVLNNCAQLINDVFDTLQLTMHQISLIDVIDADDDRLRRSELVRRSSARPTSRKRSSLSLRRASLSLRLSAGGSERPPTPGSPLLASSSPLQSSRSASGFATPSARSTKELPSRLSIASIASMDSNSIFVITTPRGTMLMEHYPDNYLPSWRSRDTSISVRTDSINGELQPIKESFRNTVNTTTMPEDQNRQEIEMYGRLTEQSVKNLSAQFDDERREMKRLASSGDKSSRPTESKDGSKKADEATVENESNKGSNSPQLNGPPKIPNLPRPNSSSSQYQEDLNARSGELTWSPNTPGKRFEESKTVENKSRTRMRRPVFISRIQTVLDEAYVQKRKIEGVFPDAVDSIEEIFETARIQLQRKHDADVHTRSLFFADLATRTSTYFAILMEEAKETEFRQRELLDQQAKSFLVRRQRSEYSLISMTKRWENQEKDELFDYFQFQFNYLRRFEIQALQGVEDFCISTSQLVASQKEAYEEAPEKFSRLPAEMGVCQLQCDLARQRCTRFMGFAKESLDSRKDVVGDIWKEQMQELELRRIDREVKSALKYAVDHVEFFGEMEDMWKESRGGFLGAKLSELERQKNLEESLNKHAEESHTIILQQLQEQEHMVHLKLNTSAKGTVLFADRHISEYNELMKEHQQIIDKLYEEEDFEPINENKAVGDKKQNADPAKTTNTPTKGVEDDYDSSVSSA